MIEGVGSSAALRSAQLTKLLSQLDTDGNQAISRDEFVAGAPDDMSTDTAGGLYDKLAGDNSSDVSVSDLASAFQQMAGGMQSTLISAQEGSGRQGPPPGGPPPGGPPPGGQGAGGQGPDAEEMFSSLDADGDGTVTQEEFLAGRPDDVSEEDATSLFESLGGTDSAGLTQDQFAEGMTQTAASAPPPPPPGGSGGSGEEESTDISDLFSSIDTDGDGTISSEEFTSLLGGSEEDSDSSSGTTSRASRTLDQFMSALAAYQRSNFAAYGSAAYGSSAGSLSTSV